jgi:putative phage-type endonuclease
MSAIVQLVQGSEEWLEHRRAHRNASETAIVLGLSPWTTPYQLWRQKLGLCAPEVNQAMLRGTQLEPAARAAYEALTGQVMQPLVLVDGDYSASLDGLTLAGDRVLEIKCPFKGRDSTLWKSVSEGQLPEYYVIQVQHQLMVTQAAMADVFVFDGTEGILLEVTPDAGTWPQMRAAWEEFMRCVATSQPPPLTDRDTRVREDPEWMEAAAAYVETKLAADTMTKALDEAKARLTSLASHPSESGSGVSVTRYWKRGAIEYKKIPELKALDLEQYRGALREETRVTLVA